LKFTATCFLNTTHTPVDSPLPKMKHFITSTLLLAAAVSALVAPLPRVAPEHYDKLAERALLGRDIQPFDELADSAVVARDTDSLEELEDAAVDARGVEPFDELLDTPVVARDVEPFDELADNAVAARDVEPFGELSDKAVVARAPHPAFYDEHADQPVARSPEADPGLWDDIKDKAKDIADNIVDTIKDGADGHIDNCNLITCAADLGPVVLDCVKAAISRGKNAKDDLTCISGVSHVSLRIYER
jgi:hypothetical protein